MRCNAGMITDKLSETKRFYTELLEFQVVFENEWFVLMATPEPYYSEISFLKPHHPSQASLFQQPFQGQGVYLTINVADVDAVHGRLQDLDVPVAVSLRDEPWGDRHFSIVDPNGIGVDIVTNPHFPL